MTETSWFSIKAKAKKTKAYTGWVPQTCQKGALQKKDFGLHTDNKLHVSQLCALVLMKTNHRLGCICKSIAIRLREVIILYWHL